jgi:glycosyltransferase involved in cell wall biosynthesis
MIVNINKSKEFSFSIVTVVMNGEEYLEETIKSVISQEYKFFEYIVIDGGSTDNTINIIKKYQNYITEWVSENDKGQTDALIKGFNKCSGDILYWLNYDDLLYDSKTLSNVADAFKENRDVGLVYGDDLLIDKHSNILKFRDFSFHTLGKLTYYKSISQPSTFFLKKVYDQFGLNNNLEYSMDLDLWLKIFSKHNVKYLNQVLSKNRIHDNRKMIAFKADAMIEAKNLRHDFGASKKLFFVYKYAYKALDLKNYIVSRFYYSKQ